MACKKRNQLFETCFPVARIAISCRPPSCGFSSKAWVLVKCDTEKDFLASWVKYFKTFIINCRKPQEYTVLDF